VASVFGPYAHVSPIGLYTNHLAPDLRVAQKLKCADKSESGANAEALIERSL
jgi:hypothetical protein